MKIIKIEKLCKSFHKQCLLKDVNIDFDGGKIHGIVGFNGSGKSVFFKLLAGFLYPDSGTININGNNITKQCRFPENMGVLINKTGFIGDRTGYENLKFLADINKRISNEKIVEFIELTGLDSQLDTKVKNYSLGMKQKLGICQAVMENQNIILLDEPFNALDKKSAVTISNLIKTLNKEGKTIFITSHRQEDIDNLCQEVYEIEDNTLKRLSK